MNEKTFLTAVDRLEQLDAYTEKIEKEFLKLEEIKSLVEQFKEGTVHDNYIRLEANEYLLLGGGKTYYYLYQISKIYGISIDSITYAWKDLNIERERKSVYQEKIPHLKQAIINAVIKTDKKNKVLFKDNLIKKIGKNKYKISYIPDEFNRRSRSHALSEIIGLDVCEYEQDGEISITPYSTVPGYLITAKNETLNTEIKKILE